MENEGKCVLKHLNLFYVDEVFEQQKSNSKGRPWVAPSIKLKTFLYDLSEGKDSIHGVARTVRTSVAQVFLGLEQGGMSYATLERFWHQLATVAEQIFQELAQMVAYLGILGIVHAVDITSISTPYLDDPDAAWSYDDSTKKDYYYRYGPLLVVGVDT